MSASPTAKALANKGCAIPTRNVILTDPSQLPNDYGTTPGGTLFSTTPGGTRIIYDRSFLMKCRNSPLAKSPPANLPNIPGLLRNTEGSGDADKKTNGQKENKPENQEEPQFEMDM